jgi:amino acid transporter
MNQRARSDDDGLLLAAAGILAVAVIAGVFLLDHVPWLLPWAVIAIILALLAAVIASVHGAVSHRVALVIAAGAVLVAAVTWAGGYGPGVNRDTRRQLRARPPAAVAPNERPRQARLARARAQQRRRRAHAGHHHQRHHPNRPRRHPTPTHAHSHTKPSAAARLYGAGQLGSWHWQRIIFGWSLLLGAPLALLGIAAGISVTRWRGDATSTPRPGPSRPGAGSLRTAGR